MEKFKGTQGPWFVDGFGDVNDTKEITESTICIAACRGVIDIERDKHNANLIAAAPDLLEALQELIRGYEGKSNSGMFDMVCHGDEIEKANAAIARALGKNDGDK